MTFNPRFTVSMRLDHCYAPACPELTRRLYLDTDSDHVYRACCLEHAERAALESQRAARLLDRSRGRFMAPWEGKDDFDGSDSR